jgi:hypothetical protein
VRLLSQITQTSKAEALWRWISGNIEPLPIVGDRQHSFCGVAADRH